VTTPYTPETLAAAVASIVEEAQARILGIGAEQYHTEGEPQKFETMSVEAMIEYMAEELLDQINYSVMNLIKLRRVAEAYSYLRVSVSLETVTAWTEALRGTPKAGV
jgi:hypothetical protein